MLIVHILFSHDGVMLMGVSSSFVGAFIYVIANTLYDDAWEECLAITINWTSRWDRKLGSDIVEIGPTGSLQWTHQVKCWLAVLYTSGVEGNWNRQKHWRAVWSQGTQCLSCFLPWFGLLEAEGASGTTNTSWMLDRTYCFTTLSYLFMEECVIPPQYCRKTSHVLW